MFLTGFRVDRRVDGVFLMLLFGSARSSDDSFRMGGGLGEGEELSTMLQSNWSIHAAQLQLNMIQTYQLEFLCFGVTTSTRIDRSEDGSSGVWALVFCSSCSCWIAVTVF